MMDIRCAVCGEPWDEYGARHGDMAPWEWTLFQKGAGCPCCQGVRPDGRDPDETLTDHLRSVVMESEEPDDYGLLYTADLGAKPPPWERPPDPVLWTCTGCGNAVKKDLDLTRDNLYWDGSNVPYFPRDGWEDALAAKPGPTSLYNGKPYCPRCLVRCDQCDELALDADTYPDPRCFGKQTLCAACYEQLSFCSYCGEVEDDESCSCRASEDHDDDSPEEADEADAAEP